ncbi:hypothetical protein DVA86_22695 [Streptomyces armeniacus]|uniref:DUF2637 domain-containing protein n=2 Tax=Streptomyces armeniacus TaxID=83291 RepID=A0A345XTR9_9ACTN|nr:hypothetical protein DVA86_22695 [Streptomyces armeniacus]
MALVVGLTFLFGFGNVWALALRLHVPPWVAPLVAPAVDLSVLGLLLGTRYLAVHGASPELLRPARRLLVFSGLVTLALNVTDPLLAGERGKAAFDAVGPLLLIGWAEVGPGLLQAISSTGPQEAAGSVVLEAGQRPRAGVEEVAPRWAEDAGSDGESDVSVSGEGARHIKSRSGEEVLLERAYEEDARHREAYQRPISAETLRKRLHVGAARSRTLVAMIRSTNSDAPHASRLRPE